MPQSKWSDGLIKNWREHNVPASIDELQRMYRRWIPMCVALTAGGVGMMCATGNPRFIASGLFIAITGMVCSVLMKTWAHLRISMFRVVWELHEQNETRSD